jgi:hypothetical protein
MTFKEIDYLNELAGDREGDGTQSIILTLNALGAR